MRKSTSLRRNKQKKQEKGCLHFENPPQEGTSLSLMTAQITTLEAILKQLQRIQQRDQLRHHLITDYFERLIR